MEYGLKRSRSLYYQANLFSLYKHAKMGGALHKLRTHRSRGKGQVSNRCPLHITCKKGGQARIHGGGGGLGGEPPPHRKAA